MRLSVTFLTAFVLAGGAATSAQGAVRYVSPTGSGAGCTSGAPCDVIVGINNAARGDDVRIAPGNYAVPVGLQGPSDLSIRGTATAADTVLTLTVAGPGSSGLWLSTRSVLSDITIRRTTASGTIGLFVADYSRAERTVVECPSPCGEAVRLSTLGRITLDSVLAWTQSGIAIRASGPGATVNGVLSAKLQNVTAVSDSTAALDVASSTARPAVVELTDSVVVGTGSADVQMHQTGQNVDQAELIARNSFLRPTISRLDGFGVYTDLGGNSGSAPTFLNRAAHDLRPAAGSPTIDANPLAVPPHPLDLAQRSRILGGGLDAGAYEFTPAPTALHASAQTIGATGATIASTFSAGGLGGNLKVEYSPSAAYGQQTAPQPTIAGDTSAATALTGLTPGQEIHYRAILTTDGGTASTADQALTVPATPAPAPTPAPATAARAISVTKVSVKSGKAEFTLSGAGVVRVQVLRGKQVRRTVWVIGRAGVNRVKFAKLPKGTYTVQVAASGAIGTASTATYRVR